MMQPSLFDGPKVKPQAVRVAVALLRCGGTATAWQLCAQLGNYMQRNVCAKRLSELAAVGCVEAMGTKRGPRGQAETIWRLTERGLRLVFDAESAA